MSEAQKTPTDVVLLCPGQGAQAVGMGKKWAESSGAAKRIFEIADETLGDALGSKLSEICFNLPAEKLNQTNVSQPAIYVCSVASLEGLKEQGASWSPKATAGLSLGEYTALHIAGVFDFETGLRLVALRGRLMQEAAEKSQGGMVALIGAEEDQAEEVCKNAAQGGVLVCANFNAPGQIVLSGDQHACDRVDDIASSMGLRSVQLTVAGAFHSPHMQPAAEGLAAELAKTAFTEPKIDVWSNVTAQLHNSNDLELIKKLLVEQLVSPVRWSQSCKNLAGNSQIEHSIEYHELAPGNVLRGLMRRIDKKTKVKSHDEP